MTGCQGWLLWSGFQFTRYTRRQRGQQLLFAIDEIGGIEGCEFEAVPVGDGVGWTSLHAVSAEDAAVVVDVVNRRVTLGAADAILVSVLGSFDVNAIGRAGSSAEKAGDALF